MTTQKLFKRRVRQRMTKTGESYTAARRHVVARRPETAADPATEPIDLGPALELASDERMVGATGHGWEHWLSILDRWGAVERRHGEIATYLSTEHGVPSWWTQSITNGYERTRGMRRKHQQADGYTIYASKTIDVPIETLFEAFVGDAVRARWLTDGSMSVRNARATKVARFDWDGGPTRVMVTFEAKSPTRSTAHVAHERIADAVAAEEAKALWKRRVAALKTFLEAEGQAGT